MNDRIHPADPSLRRWALWLLATVAVIGASLLVALHWMLGQPSERLPIDGLLFGFAGLSVVVAAIAGGLAWSLWQEATRVLREDRYPPSDMRTLRDVPICHGELARRMAQRMRLASVTAGVLSIAVVLWSWWALRQLG